MADSKAVYTKIRGGHGDVHAMNHIKEPGLWGTDGLLAVPNVKMVIFLACLFHVMWGRSLP